MKGGYLGTVPATAALLSSPENAHCRVWYLSYVQVRQSNPDVALAANFLKIPKPEYFATSNRPTTLCKWRRVAGDGNPNH